MIDISDILIDRGKAPSLARSLDDESGSGAYEAVICAALRSGRISRIEEAHVRRTYPTVTSLLRLLAERNGR